MTSTEYSFSVVAALDVTSAIYLSCVRACVRASVCVCREGGEEKGGELI